MLLGLTEKFRYDIFVITLVFKTQIDNLSQNSENEEWIPYVLFFCFNSLVAFNTIVMGAFFLYFFLH